MSWNFELVAGPYGGTTEGPVWDGEALLFTHIPASRILRYSPKTGETTEYFTGTNHTNGLCFDAQGNLYGCQSGGRRIVRFEKGRGHHHFIAPPLGRQAAQQPQRPGRRQAGAHLVHRPFQRVRRETRNSTTCRCCGLTLCRPVVGS